MASVLLVDDDADIRESRGELLEVVGGFDVQRAASVADAIRAVDERIFDLIVTDKNMGGSRGIAPFLQRARTVQPQTPILLHTGEPDTGALQQLGCDGFHMKGDDSDDFIEAVRRLAGRSSRRPQRWAEDDDYYADKL